MASVKSACGGPFDARTGRRVWRYEHKLPEDWGGYNEPFFTGKHRGLAIYGENIYFLSNDVKLHAINYKTGVAKFVKGWTEFQYPKEFTKAKDANGYFLTMTTCWPLWAGAFATQRYVIFSDQFSPRMEANGTT